MGREDSTPAPGAKIFLAASLDLADVHPRHEWLIAFERMDVRVFSELSFVQMLSGYLPLDGVTHH